MSFRAQSVFLFFAIFCTLIYAASLFFPYYLLDDLWIFRLQEEGFPGRSMIAIVQGRPVFWLLIAASKELHEWLGPLAVSLVRAQAVLWLAIFGLALFLWIRRWTESPGFALVVAALTVTLPGTQMYVIGGPWLAWAFAYGALFPLIVDRILAAPALDRRRLVWLALATAGIGFGFATYQATPLVALALLVVPLTMARPLTRRDLTVIAAVAAAIFAALFVYYALWFGLNVARGVGGDGRYSPLTAFSGDLVQQVTGRFLRFYNERLPMLWSFWDVTWGARVFWWPVLGLLAAGAAADLWRMRAVRAKRWVFMSLLAWSASLLLLPLSDAAALSSPPGTPVFSYMTSGPVSVANFLLLAGAALALARAIALLVPSLQAAWAAHRSIAAGLGAACILAAGLAAGYTATAYYVLPAWIEHGLVRSQLRVQAAELGHISAVTAYEKPVRSVTAGGRQEYQWSNLGSSFYVHWMTRRLLEELGLDSHVRIDVVAPNGRVNTSPDFSVPEDPATRAVVDLVNVSLDRTWSPPPARVEPVLPVISSPAAAERIWHETLPGSEPIALRVVRSTFQFEGPGASGETALVDGELSTAAADAKGLHSGTELVVRAADVRTFTHVRVMSAWKHGIESEAELAIATSLDGEAWVPNGTLHLRPGVASVATAALAAPTRAHFLRLSYSSGQLQSNIWLAEVGIWARSEKADSRMNLRRPDLRVP